MRSNMTNTSLSQAHNPMQTHAAHIAGGRSLSARIATRTGPTLRIGLRLWGFVDTQVGSWLGDLPDQDGRLSWEAARHHDGAGVALIIHLVKSSSAVLSSFCWNCAGASHAMRQSQGKCPVQIALFAGDASRLPAGRTGLWAFAGNCSTRAALCELTRTVVVPHLLR
ncbi:hypothetical protein CUJ88_44435 (plasmid) [Paraburkholderia hospita]|nr:hypothetical protein CUJ88_44435 [Paraburkholderia hospita]